jgi:hypothetical protein
MQCFLLNYFTQEGKALIHHDSSLLLHCNIEQWLFRRHDIGTRDTKGSCARWQCQIAIHSYKKVDCSENFRNRTRFTVRGVLHYLCLRSPEYISIHVLCTMSPHYCAINGPYFRFMSSSLCPSITVPLMVPIFDPCPLHYVPPLLCHLWSLFSIHVLCTMSLHYCAINGPFFRSMSSAQCPSINVPFMVPIFDPYSLHNVPPFLCHLWSQFSIHVLCIMSLHDCAINGL